ncbi:enoyl-CoA hydratase [Sphingobium sp. SCG-1]|uniref:enoyl-CoA hydratase-related protein n=1 Tax=Sphingobium sp. SCG-1 TaxID=2072936 RepID=UPI000CD68FF5|nr:enoyl-CoA hydratase-related protein [Sphingobium sp. SCG-1]AUW57141.1 enoyl-CoA hydratase [Sphingobium sp. SCG-1]
MHVVLEMHDRVALVTLSRPDRLNAMDSEMGRLFDRVMVEVALDDQVRAVVLTGAGRAFCAGADMQRLSDFSQSGEGPTLPERGKAQGKYQALEGIAPPELLNRYSAPQAIPKPVIAAINGPCAGVGLALAVMCDIRLASRNAYFLAPFANRGLVAETGLASSLAAVVGFAAATDMLLSARKIFIEEALRIGLAQQVHDQSTLVEKAVAYADEMARLTSPRTGGIIKRQLWRARATSYADALADSMDETRACMQTEDFREGIASFKEKRPPRFTGR